MTVACLQLYIQSRFCVCRNLVKCSNTRKTPLGVVKLRRGNTMKFCPGAQCMPEGTNIQGKIIISDFRYVGREAVFRELAVICTS